MLPSFYGFQWLYVSLYFKQMTWLKIADKILPNLVAHKVSKQVFEPNPAGCFITHRKLTIWSGLSWNFLAMWKWGMGAMWEQETCGWGSCGPMLLEILIWVKKKYNAANFPDDIYILLTIYLKSHYSFQFIMAQWYIYMQTGSSLMQ